MIYESDNGFKIEIEGVFQVKKGIVFTGRIREMPNGQQEILTDSFAGLLKGQRILGKTIAGTEWFATSYQRVGSNIGLYVEMDK